MKVIEKIAFYFYNKAKTYKKKIAQKLSPKNVRLGNVFIEGDVSIGEFTYINGGIISAGLKSKILIGVHCAIGRGIHIRSHTHDLTCPTSDENHSTPLHIEKDINIGNYVWIGDNVFIKPGVVIADYSVIGANSVVTKNVSEFEIVGGVPAHHIRYNTSHYKYKKS